MKAIQVRKYGVKLLNPKQNEPIIHSVLAQQNRLWNAFVEIEYKHREEYRAAVVQSSAELTVLDEQYKAEEAVMDSLLEARAKNRSQARRKATPENQAMTAAIKTSAQRLKDLRAQMRELRTAAKAIAKPLTDELELQRRQRVKEATAASPLWWCHSETIISKYDIARVRAMKENTTLKFRRFEGSGSMGIRFSVDGGNLEKIHAGKTDLLMMEDPTPEILGRAKLVKADGGRRVLLTLRAGPKDEEKNIPKIQFLMTIHSGHTLPTDMPLKTVNLTRKVNAGHSEYSVVFTFTKEVEALPEVELPTNACGIDFGFRLVIDPESDNRQSLRVGTVNWGDRVEHCLLDADWIRRIDYAEKVRGDLDSMAVAFQTEMMPLLSADNLETLGVSEDEWFAKLCGKVRRAKGAYAALLIDLCKAHAQANNPFGEVVGTRMTEWAKYAQRKALAAYNIRRKAVDHRKHIFRNFAANLVKKAGLIAMVDTDFRKIAELRTPEGEENELHLAARRNRTLAAPSELRLAIENAAKREQREIIKVPASNVTNHCSHCGHINPSNASLMLVCQSCHAVYDRDVNSSANVRNYGLNGDFEA